jgi:hypothetical protein
LQESEPQQRLDRLLEWIPDFDVPDEQPL